MNSKIEFKQRHFEKGIILLMVRWYLSYPLSYRDIEKMMLEHGIQVDHSTINRWVTHYLHYWKMNAEINLNVRLILARGWMKRILK